MANSGRAMITLLIVCGLLHCATATIYNVGGDAGWTLLTSASSPSYDSEFAGITLQQGDGLNFTFAEGAHDILQVTTNAADCNVASAFVTYNTSNIFYIYSMADAQFSFICGLSNHCSEYGMHLTVTLNVSSAEAPAGSSAAESPPSPRLPEDAAGKASVVETTPALFMGALLAVCALLFL